MQCQAYIERTKQTPRWGRLHCECTRQAVGERIVSERGILWRNDQRTLHLCGTHLKMLDEGRAPRLRPYDR